MEQTLVFATLGLALVLFIWGRIRHDIVAMISLLILVMAGIVSPQDAFAGFAHPAVITVAAVLVVSSGLQHSGLVEVISHWVLKLGNSMTLQITALCALVCVLSAFMNNVGALAILMPVAIHIARKSGHSPSFYLMPLAFGSLLGGMTTLIGTPPNIIIGTFRADVVGQSFGMFDFAPVGVGVALAGWVFVSLLGWRALPKRQGPGSDEDRFRIQDYITEVQITEDSILNGIALENLNEITDSHVVVLGLIRNKRLRYAPDRTEVFRTDDILIIEAGSKEMKEFVEKSKTRLVGREDLLKDAFRSSEITMAEAVVMEGAPIVDQTAVSMKMRSRFGVNLLAIARQEKKIRQRLDHVQFMPGDVLLIQGYKHIIDDAMKEMGCLPLADRGFTIGEPKKVILSLTIFAGAIASVIIGLMEVQIAFAMAAVLMVLTSILPMPKIYTAIDWPVIVLLGAMLPVGAALETSGGAELIARKILIAGEAFPVWATLTLLLVATMFLSDLINNAATVVVMAPIGISLAKGMQASADPFLIVIAIGASCAFLTPIGHQSNTLVMGPGGYKFSDYWRMGLPLEVIITLIGIPLVMYFWPL